MTFELLVSTMNQNDYSLPERMGIDSDAVIVNQCDHYGVRRFSYKSHEILWIDMPERGIGISRNTALMHSKADIVLFADDDAVYTPGYAEKILNSYVQHPEADMLLADFDIIYPDRTLKARQSFKRIRLFNALHYGTLRFSGRRDSFLAANLSFSLLFGGGARYSCGEDSIFLSDAIRRHLRVYTLDYKIGSVYQLSSSWFRGYNELYFHDKGVLMKAIFGFWAYPLTLALLLKNRSQTRDFGLNEAIKASFCGIKEQI